MNENKTVSKESNRSKKSALTVRETVLFPMLGTLMFCSKLLLEWAPNIHLLAAFTIAFTLVYRKKALIPIYIFVLLTGLYGGFSPWWIPHLYLWALLWGATMLLPRRMPKKIAIPVYTLLATLHGLFYGALYAPAQALLFGLDFRGMLLWIAAGAPFDILHAVGNFAASLLILPLTELLRKLEKQSKQ